MFSTTTMASSTSEPSARISANSATRLMVTPARPSAITTDSITSGTTSITISPSRQPSVSSSVPTTVMMAMPRCSTSVLTASSALSPSLRVVTTSTPAGTIWACMCCTRACTS